MAREPAGGLLALLRRIPPAPDSDDELLDRFARERDAGAFAALVTRHGPAVFAVCRRALQEAAAEDAFQAVFVALAREAGRVGRRGTVAGWLYRVAVRTARRLAARPPAFEPLPADAPAPNAPDAAHRELLAALEDEVGALPDRLRAAVVLCALEGRTSAEAAAVLGCPVGTVDSRLHAARRKLRERLARRGFGLPAIGATLAAISPELAQSANAARAARAVLAATAGAPPSPAVAEILQEMTPVRTRLKLFVAIGAALVAAAAGLGLHALANPPTPPSGAKPRNVPPEAAEPPDPKREQERAYQSALVAGMHRLCESSFDVEHLAALLERHPKLVNERVTFKRSRKPLATDGYTALHWAARGGNTEAVALLLRYKADPNATAGADWTPLHLAAQRGDLEICKALVTAGAKPGAKTFPLPGGVAAGSPPDAQPPPQPPISALTPLDLARDGKHAAVVEYLTNLQMTKDK